VEKVSAPEPAAGPATDCFALLQEPRRPWLDPESLKSHFLELTGKFHPDKVAGDKAVANQRFAGLNAAYHRLLEPKERLRHLLELEAGATLKDAHSVPSDAMDLMMAIGQTCRETDQFLAARSKASSPLLKVQMFEAGMAWTEKLNQLRQQIDLRREKLLADLKSMNPAWDAAPPPGALGRAAALPLDRLEQACRSFSYIARWTEQVQERLVQLSF
jgi:curved DNA-binding protein CbpA